MVGSGASWLQSASCSPTWVDEFGSLNGLGLDAQALAIFDDGSGPALYAAGQFLSAGGVAANRIAKWDGTTWSPLGSGLTHTSYIPIVFGLAVFDDGSGPALYACGSFDTAGGVLTGGVARWNGTSWSALPGLSSNSVVYALKVYDDGSGPALYTGPQRWNGVAWQTLNAGVSPVYALEAFDDGSGMALYAGGAFASRVLKWNGSVWMSAGSGMPNTVLSFARFDDGSGPALYASGYFDRVVKLVGPTWTPLPDSGFTTTYGLGVFDDGSGSALYAGGRGQTPTTTSGVRRWNGSTWTTPGSDVKGGAQAFLAFDDGSGPALFAAGGFTRVGSLPAASIAKWNGTSWSSTGTGDSIEGPVHAATVMTDGSGTALYVAVDSFNAYTLPGGNVLRWDVGAPTPLGGSFDGSVRALAVADFGNGPELYAGGAFTSAGGQPVNRVARWTGAGWAPLGAGITNPTMIPPYVTGLVAFDDGTGPALYATGCFHIAGGVGANNVARWNGSSWFPLGSGLGDCGMALEVFDDGHGARLYAGGVFTTAGGTTVNRIARWTGTGWTSLAGGVGTIAGYHEVKALTVLDDGTGSALYAGGLFPTVGALQANNVAKWNGTSWAVLGSGVDREVFALTSFDDGSGRRLSAGGQFSNAGGAPAARVARFDPATGWSALGSGVSEDVLALTVFDKGSGDGPALYVAGSFGAAFDSGDAFLAEWQPCPGAALVSSCFGDGSGSACPCGNSGAVGHGCANSLFASGARLDASGSAHVVHDSLVLRAVEVPNGSALYFQGTSMSGGGSGTPFGDGLRCAGGTVIRLGVEADVSNQSAYPGATEPAISVRGGCQSGDVRIYQVWYRNAASFCTSATFNLTNAMSVTWGP